MLQYLGIKGCLKIKDKIKIVKISTIIIECYKNYIIAQNIQIPRNGIMLHKTEFPDNCISIHKLNFVVKIVKYFSKSKFRHQPYRK